MTLNPTCWALRLYERLYPRIIVSKSHGNTSKYVHPRKRSMTPTDDPQVTSDPHLFWVTCLTLPNWIIVPKFHWNSSTPQQHGTNETRNTLNTNLNTNLMQGHRDSSVSPCSLPEITEHDFVSILFYCEQISLKVLYFVHKLSCLNI